MWTFAVAALVLLAVAPLGAQEALTSPYREEQTSEIRGLSEREIRELREGQGMGLARAAELNGYPGPRHVLDAVEAGQFQLTPDQLRAVRQLYERMSHDARRLGQVILGEEAALEAAFRAGMIAEPDLRERVGRLAGLYGEVRAVHLHTHVETRALLTDDQVERYNELRGYSQDRSGRGSHHPAGH